MAALVVFVPKTESSVFFLLFVVLLLLRGRFSGGATLNDLQTIQELCKNTVPNYDLCVKTLTSDPNGLTADRNALAGIALDASLIHAAEGVLYMDKIAAKARGKRRREGYATCRDFYNLTVVPHIKQSEFYFHVQDWDNTVAELTYCFGHSQMCLAALKDLPPRGHTPPLRNTVELQMNLCEITQIFVLLIRYANL